MSIYSLNLGHLNANDHQTFHTVYTVPVAQGPAVVRSISIQANPGTQVIVRVVFPDTVACLIGYVDNATGTQRVVENIITYQPLAPGTTIEAENNFTADGPYTVIVGGYQFAQP